MKRFTVNPLTAGVAVEPSLFGTELIAVSCYMMIRLKSAVISSVRLTCVSHHPRTSPKTVMKRVAKLRIVVSFGLCMKRPIWAISAKMIRLML